MGDIYSSNDLSLNLISPNGHLVLVWNYRLSLFVYVRKMQSLEKQRGSRNFRQYF